MCKFLFVAGSFRSGTSLLYACLNQHPKISLMYETSLQDSHLPDWLFFHRRWMDNANAWGKFLSRHDLPHHPYQAQEIFSSPQDIYIHYGKKKGAEYVGEKTPSYMAILPELVEKFPTAKIITISRDPAAIYRSVLRAGKDSSFFARNGMMEKILFLQGKMLKNLISLKQNGVNVLSLTYDELSKETEKTTRRICDYLELEYEPAMCSLDGADLSSVYQATHHIKLRSGKIEPTPANEEEILPVSKAALDEVWNHWQENLSWLRGDTTELPAKKPLPPEIAAMEATGRKIHFWERWKRRIYHLMPAEAIRVLRSAKIVVKRATDAEAEYIPPEQKKRNRIFALIACLSFSAAGGILTASFGGRVSPLFFFLLVPLIAGWSWGGKPIFSLSLFAATVWSFSQFYYFYPQMSLFIVGWNLFSRTVAFVVLGIFAWHLKAVLLDHMKNQRFDESENRNGNKGELSSSKHTSA